MKNNGGLLIFFDEEQRRGFIKNKADGGYEKFSDALSVLDWEVRQFSVALLSFSEETIDYIALTKKGKRVATSKSRVEFSELVPLKSIPISVIEAKLSVNIRQHFIRTSRGFGGRIPEKTWADILRVVKELRPDAVNDIDRLLSLRRYAGFQLSGDAAEVLLQEREALGAALDIFSGGNQLREQVLGAWAPQNDTVVDIDEEASKGKLDTSAKPSFLAGIPSRYIQEESAIQHDLFSWEGLQSSHEAGISVFEQGDRRLEVIYANRNALERTLGVDLIYYNEIYGLFVLIQYKLMREEGEAMLYRPDAQLHEELKRMDEFASRFEQKMELTSHENFRLNADGFMIKLVPNTGLKPASGELIKGMYLTREYMRFLVGADGPKGPKGGSTITFDSAPRYLTNTEFAQAINRGWLGTRGVQSEVIRDLVRQYYESGNAVIFAHEGK